MLINGVDLKDNGTYECRAEVESHGNVKIRLVSLEVLCECQQFDNVLLVDIKFKPREYKSDDIIWIPI